MIVVSSALASHAAGEVLEYRIRKHKSDVQRKAALSQLLGEPDHQQRMPAQLEEGIPPTYPLDPQQLAPQRRERLFHLALWRFVPSLHHGPMIRHWQRLSV